LKHQLFIFLLLVSTAVDAQNLDYVKGVVDTLTTPSMHGRGYVKNGDKIAAEFIEHEFADIGLRPFVQGSYRQEFSLAVNTFPGTVKVSIDNEVLEPGKDFIVSANSPGFFGTFKLYRFANLILKTEKEIEKFNKKTDQFKFIIIDETDLKKGEENALFDATATLFKARGIIVLKDKLTWSISQEVGRFPVIEIIRDRLTDKSTEFVLDIESIFRASYKSQNIIGYIKGENPDSFIVFSAHYDHLGRMGPETYFPGGNDNASGTAMLLDLAKHYFDSVPKYTTVFIAFGGEEAGLVGSKYYTENPFFSLRRIKFLINLDLMGNGDEGITVVNGTEFKDEFDQLVQINDSSQYVKEVIIRGKAQNSDHYYFTEKGVPSFFIYTLGGSKAYHDIYDDHNNVPFTKYEEVFHLLVDFIQTIH